jgi:hypothetical protein
MPSNVIGHELRDEIIAVVIPRPPFAPSGIALSLRGAIRDLSDVRRMGLTAYVQSKSPRTAVGHYATIGTNIPAEYAAQAIRSA